MLEFAKQDYAEKQANVSEVALMYAHVGDTEQALSWLKNHCREIYPLVLQE